VLAALTLSSLHVAAYLRLVLQISVGWSHEHPRDESSVQCKSVDSIGLHYSAVHADAGC